MGLEGIEGGMEEADVPAGAACEGHGVGPDSRKTVDRNVKGNVEEGVRLGAVWQGERGKRLWGGGWKEGLWSDGEGNGGCSGRRNGRVGPEASGDPVSGVRTGFVQEGGRRVLRLDRWALPGKSM